MVEVLAEITEGQEWISKMEEVVMVSNLLNQFCISLPKVDAKGLLCPPLSNQRLVINHNLPNTVLHISLGDEFKFFYYYGYIEIHYKEYYIKEGLYSSYQESQK